MYQETSVEPACVRVWGRQAALEIRSPRHGVLRLRHAPSSLAASLRHPELGPKRSFAVVRDEELPLVFHPSDDAPLIAGPGVEVKLSLADGTWRFSSNGEPLAECVRIAGEVKAGYPVPEYRSTLALRAPEGEAYLGFGEKVGPLDKRGMRLVFWNTDVMPHHSDTDPLYASIPFFIAMRNGVAWGLFVDESWRSEVDVALADPATVQWDVSGPELDVYLIAGPKPADVIRRYTALTGRSPLPPLWSLGAQQSRYGYESTDDVLGVIHGYRSRGLPLDCVYLDIDYMEGFRVFTWDRGRYPSPRELSSRAASENVRLVTIVDPGVSAEPGYRPYDEGLSKNYFVRLDRGGVLHGEVWPKRAAFPDFSREDVRGWWAEQHRELFADGISGVWLDMNEPSCFKLEQPVDTIQPSATGRGLPARVEGKTLPYDARHGEKRHIEVHNAYGLGMAQATFEAFRRFAPERRPFILTRAGYAGIQRYAAMWTGDNSSHWGHLELSIPMLLGLGLSGVPFVGVDVPGFLGRPSGELMVRWCQAATFYPLWRNHSVKGSPSKEPWRFGEPYLSHAKAALLRRYRLLPALYTLMHEASETGLPPLRPLALSFPGEPEAVQAFDQLLFGPDLLVAPLVRPGQTRRLAWLPRGSWLELPELGSAGAKVEGSRHVVAEAPIDRVPMWLREGGVLALAPPAPHTTTAAWPELEWHIHAGPQIRGSLYEDEGDGYGPSRTTSIEGELGPGGLHLERRSEGALAVSRRLERIFLFGCPPPSSVSGAIRHQLSGGALVLEVAPDWSRIDVRL